MSKKSAGASIQIRSFEDLIGKNQSMMPEAEDMIVDIAIEELVSFTDHPFRVVDDEQMDELVLSIKDHGILTPLLVRRKSDHVYEIISGHRRTRAAHLAGLDKLPAIIRELSYEEAVVEMVNTNVQREHVLPSEKAHSYKMEYDALKHQGQKNSGRALKKMMEASGESQMTIHRYIRLNELVPRLLDMVDAERIGFTQGVNLSYLSAQEQEWTLRYMEEYHKSISLKQSEELKAASQNGELVSECHVLEICNPLTASKPKKKLAIKMDKLQKYFPEDVTEEHMEEVILNLLKNWSEVRHG